MQRGYFCTESKLIAFFLRALIPAFLAHFHFTAPQKNVVEIDGPRERRHVPPQPSPAQPSPAGGCRAAGLQGCRAAGLQGYRATGLQGYSPTWWKLKRKYFGIPTKKENTYNLVVFNVKNPWDPVNPSILKIG